jgi:predicted permease
VQILLGVVLLGGAGLFVRTVDHLRHQWIGFETDRLTTFSLDPSLSGYGGEQAVQIETNVMEKLRAIPGIASVAATDDAELTGNTNSSTFTVQGHQMTENEDMNFENPHITPGYFATLRQPLLAGREFTLADSKSAPKVAIVNLALARRFYGSPQNALGRMVAIGGGPDVVPDATIVGVVGDVKHTDLRTDPRATVYRPYAQLEQIWTPGGGQIYVRSSQAPKSVEAAIRQSVHAFDPTLVVDGLRTMEEQVSQQASTERALAVLALGFAVIAMLLAAVGFYGVLSYSTEQRTREIGVRLALGAQRWSVVSLIVREMAAIASVAILLALPAIVVLARLFRSQLYGVTTFDPLSLCTAVGLTAVIVVFAAMLPARRAVSVDPMDALRSE